MSNKLKIAIRRNRQKLNPQGTDPVASVMLDNAELKIEELFESLLEDMKVMGMAELKKVAATIKRGEKGEKGSTLILQGPKGDTGNDGESIVGPRGPEGKQGKSIQGPKGETGDRGTDGNEISHTVLMQKINSKSGTIEISTIRGLERYLRNLQQLIREKGKSGGGQRRHGGGMTLTAGTNITLTRNSNGTWTIDSSTGSSISTEQVTPVASGSDVTIALSQLANTSTGVKFVSRNGQVLMPNGSGSLPGSSWSQSGSTVTVYNADESDIYLIQYSHA